MARQKRPKTPPNPNYHHDPIPIPAPQDTSPTQPKLPENKFPVVVKNKGGRPSDFNNYIGDLICAEIASGKSLRKVLLGDGMPTDVTVFRWLRSFPEFQMQYAQACEDRSEGWIEEIAEIADDTSNDTIIDKEGNERPNSEWIARSRLRVDTRKWIAGKMKPKKYGDKVTQEITGPGGGAVQHQVATVVIKAEDLTLDARESLRAALLLGGKTEDEGE